MVSLTKFLLYVHKGNLWTRICIDIVHACVWSKEMINERERKSSFRFFDYIPSIMELSKLKSWRIHEYLSLEQKYPLFTSILSVNFWLLEGFKDTINLKGSFRKNFSLNLPLLLGEREPFPGWHSSSYPIGNRGRGSAIFVQLGCIHHTALCKSESRKLSTSISRRERNEKRGSRYFVYMPRFLHFISPVR